MRGRMGLRDGCTGMHACGILLDYKSYVAKIIDRELTPRHPCLWLHNKAEDSRKTS